MSKLEERALLPRRPYFQSVAPQATPAKPRPDITKVRALISPKANPAPVISRRAEGKGVLVAVRFQPDLLARLDAHIGESETSRPEAIRLLLEKALP